MSSLKSKFWSDCNLKKSAAVEHRLLAVAYSEAVLLLFVLNPRRITLTVGNYFFYLILIPYGVGLTYCFRLVTFNLYLFHFFFNLLFASFIVDQSASLQSIFIFCTVLDGSKLSFLWTEAEKFWFSIFYIHVMLPGINE